jgi:tetratricopeptide (TPR) repeat protein
MKWAMRRTVKRAVDAHRLMFFLGTALLAGCTTVPHLHVATPQTKSDANPLITKHQNRALTLMREGSLAEAALQWEILALLEPDKQEYRRRLEETRALINKATSEHLRVAEKAMEQGQTEQASLAYLKVLALNPFNQTAAQRLRALEQEKLRTGPLARAPRITLSTDTTPRTKPAPAAEANERRDLDLGVMLHRQEDYLGSIRVLGKYLQDYPADGLAKQYLAEAHVQRGHQLAQQGKKEGALASFEKAQSLDGPDTPELGNQIRALKKTLAEEYYQQGLRAYQTDINKAIQYWQRSLQYDPNHLQAGLRLEQAKRMQQKLKAIQ